jgi:hypothetical protein
MPHGILSIVNLIVFATTWIIKVKSFLSMSLLITNLFFTLICNIIKIYLITTVLLFVFIRSCYRFALIRHQTGNCATPRMWIVYPFKSILVINILWRYFNKKNIKYCGKEEKTTYWPIKLQDPTYTNDPTKYQKTNKSKAPR